jgi:PAS domain S-box-containing protein
VSIRPKKLGLLQKALIPIAILVGFQLVILSSLFWMLNQAEEEVKREACVRSILVRCRTLTKALTGGAAIGYNTISGKLFLQRYRKAIENLPEELEQLQRMSGFSKEELATLNQFEKTISSLKLKTDEGSKLIDEGKTEQGSAMLDSLTGVIADVWSQSENVLMLVRRVEANAPVIQTNTRNNIKLILLSGAGFNVILAFFLAWGFHQGAQRRLNNLMSNVFSLSAGKPLQPPLPGTDEIARLDRVFVNVAEALRQSTEKLKESEARIRSMFEFLPAGLAVIGKAGKVELINPAAERMFGYSEEEITGKSFNELFGPDKPGGQQNLLETLDQRTDDNPVEAKALRKDGKSFQAEITASAFMMGGEEKKLAIILDASQRHELEQMKQQLISMVSHDLRTPLTSINASLKILGAGIAGQLTEKAAKQVTVAQKSTERLLRLVNDLLDIERLASGNFPLDRKNLPVIDALESAAESVKALANEKGVPVETADTQLMVYADSARLEQVLINLVSNAIKFSPQDAPVRLEASQVNGEVEFRVIDRGRGVPPEYTTIIFERFGQVKQEDSERGKGTGLGLPICKALVEAHGGSIGVKSKAGEGSTFWFRIPTQGS